MANLLPYPCFCLARPEGVSNEPWFWLVLITRRSRIHLLGAALTRLVNCCLLEMKVSYGAREAAREKRGRCSGASGSSARSNEEPTPKSSKNAVLEAGGSRAAKVVSAEVSCVTDVAAGKDRGAKAASGKPPRAPSSKIFVSKAEELKRKVFILVVILFLLLRRIWVVTLL